MKVMHYHALRLSTIVAILIVISESKASVTKNDAELLVR